MDEGAPTVTHLDPTSRDWRSIERWARDGIEKARDALESAGLDPTETERLRGQVLALRALLALAEPKNAPLSPVDYSNG